MDTPNKPEKSEKRAQPRRTAPQPKRAAPMPQPHTTQGGSGPMESPEAFTELDLIEKQEREEAEDLQRHARSYRRDVDPLELVRQRDRGLRN